jgi:predicted aldo/keto reductase-like oxidoreductase
MGAVQAFEILKKQGKTRHLMMSQHSNTAEVFAAAVESGLFDVIQIPVNPTVPMDYFTKEKFIHKASQDEYLGLIQKASDKNIGITAMKVFLGSPKTWDQVPDLRSRVGKYLPDNRSIATALIHWTMAVPGVKAFGNLLYSFDELRENIEAIGGELTAFEDVGLREFAAAISPQICRGCTACEKANPGGVAVPDILRFSMYHTGYGQPEMARRLYADLPRESRVNPGTDALRYEAACPYRLPVGRLLSQAHARLA